MLFVTAVTMLSLQGGSSVVDGKSDSQDFQRLTSAMEVLGIKVGACGHWQLWVRVSRIGNNKPNKSLACSA